MSTALNPIKIDESYGNLGAQSLFSTPHITMGNETLIASNASNPIKSTQSFPNNNQWDDSICSEPYTEPIDIDLNDPGATVGSEYTYWNYPPKDKEEEIRRYKKNILASEGKDENRFYDDTVGAFTGGPGFLISSCQVLDNFPICKPAEGNNPARLLTSEEKDELYRKGIEYGNELCPINSEGKRKCGKIPKTENQQHIFKNVYIPSKIVNETLDKLVRAAYQQCENSFNHTPFPWSTTDSALRELCVQKVYNSGKSLDKYVGTRNAIFNNRPDKVVDIIKNGNIPQSRINHWYKLAEKSMAEQNSRGQNSIRNDAIRRGYNETNIVPKKR